MANYGCTRYISINCFELTVNCIGILTIKHGQFFRKHSRKFYHNLMFSLSMHGNMDLVTVFTKLSLGMTCMKQLKQKLISYLIEDKRSSAGVRIS